MSIFYVSFLPVPQQKLSLTVQDFLLTMVKRSADSLNETFPVPRKRNRSSELLIQAARIESELQIAEFYCDHCLSLPLAICWISNSSLKCSQCVRDKVNCSMSEIRSHSQLVQAFCSIDSKIEFHLDELERLRKQKKVLTSHGVSGRGVGVVNEHSILAQSSGAQANGSSDIPQEPSDHEGQADPPVSEGESFPISLSSF